jgi:hypothetical protein
LELFFGLSIPFIDFRIGVQGTSESFSFIIGKEEKEKKATNLLKLLKISRLYTVAKLENI